MNRQKLRNHPVALSFAYLLPLCFNHLDRFAGWFMEKKDLDIETIKRYWVTEAEEGLNVAGHLFEKGDYSYALFFGHLAIEKLLKGLYVERKHKHPPRIHNT